MMHHIKLRKSTFIKIYDRKYHLIKKPWSELRFGDIFKYKDKLYQGGEYKTIREGTGYGDSYMVVVCRETDENLKIIPNVEPRNFLLGFTGEFGDLNVDFVDPNSIRNDKN